MGVERDSSSKRGKGSQRTNKYITPKAMQLPMFLSSTQPFTQPKMVPYKS